MKEKQNHFINCERYGLNQPDPEYKFHPVRKWRLDYAYPGIKLAIEIEGGVFMIKSRHTHPLGFIKDMEKYNSLTELGWKLLRYQPRKIDFEQVKKVYDMLVEENNYLPF